MKDDKQQLHRCPFCGGDVVEVTGLSKLCMIYCPECGATVSFQGCENNPEGKRKTAECWNRRKGEA